MHNTCGEWGMFFIYSGSIFVSSTILGSVGTWPRYIGVYLQECGVFSYFIIAVVSDKIITAHAEMQCSNLFSDLTCIYSSE